MSYDLIVTGASGFIGKHLKAALSKTQLYTFFLEGRSDLDLSDVNSLKHLPKARRVIHLAGIGTPAYFKTQRSQAWQANLVSTLNLLNWAVDQEVEQFLLASTAYVYGPQYQGSLHEDLLPAPNHPYPQSKYLCEQLLDRFSKDYSIQCSAMRFFNVYGPGQLPHALLPTIIKQLKQAQMNLRDPNPCRDYIHVKDIVESLLTCIDKKNDLPDFALMNVGSGESISVKALAETVCEIAQVSPKIQFELPTNETKDDIFADIKRIQSWLDWTPQFNISKGIKDVLQCEL